MKISKKFIIYLFAVLIFILYLLSANYLFNIFFKTKDESRLSNINLPSETHALNFKVDEVRRKNIKWKKGLFLRGWVYKTVDPQEKRDVYLVLKSPDKTLIFDVGNDSISRPDVKDFFQLDIGFNKLGFEAILPLYLLEEDCYKIGFAVVDEMGKYYSASRMELRKKSADFTLVNLDTISNTEKEKPGYGLSHQVTLNMLKATGKITCNFDSVSNSKEFLNVRGWGFIKGLDANSLTTYIVLKKNKNVLVFDLKKELRQDVTSHFNKAGLNLDSSGFQAVIPTKDLEKGNYQLGLYILKGNNSGIVYSGDVIKIRK